MDRQTIYSGQVPRSADLLTAQQDAMVALGELSSTILGTPTLVDSFTVVPTIPATLNVQLTPGNIYQLENLEESTWSALPSNTAVSILKQGISFINAGAILGVGIAATIGITPPVTVSYSQVFLIEVQYEDADEGALVLPYYNAANPNNPFSGPGNSGSAQNTVRYGAVAYQAKAGVAAPTGTQVAPTPDAGWTGLFYVTVANGQTTITSGNITAYPTAPFLATNGKLPQIPTGVLNNTWAYGVDTGAVNAMVVTLAPIPLSYVPGMGILVKVANSNTGATTINVNGLGSVAVHRANGSALQSGDLNASMVAMLVYDGTAFQVLNFEGFSSSTVNNNTFTLTIPYSVDSGSVNTVVGPFSPAITSLAAGLTVEVKIGHTNTGAATLQCNSTSAQPIVNPDGSALGANQLVASQVALFIYNGSAFELIAGGSGAAAVQSGRFIRRWKTANSTYSQFSGNTDPFPGNANQNALPVITQGTQVASLTITPQSANSVFDVSFSANFLTIDIIESYLVWVMIFRQDGTCVAVSKTDAGAAWASVVFTSGHDEPNTASAITYSARVITASGAVIGMNGSPVNEAGINGTPAGMQAVFIANEIQAG